MRDLVPWFRVDVLVGAALLVDLHRRARMLLSLQLLQVEEHCAAALDAAWRLEKMVQARQSDLVWREVHVFLSSVAMVSKMLWPPGRRAWPRVLLRDALGVPSDPSPVFSRAVRDSWEHLDERLEEWALRSQRANYFDRLIIGSGLTFDRLISPQPERENVLRWLDVEHGTIHFMSRDESVVIPELTPELHRLMQRAREEQEGLRRLR